MVLVWFVDVTSPEAKPNPARQLFCAVCNACNPFAIIPHAYCRAVGLFLCLIDLLISAYNAIFIPFLWCVLCYKNRRPSETTQYLKLGGAGGACLCLEREAKIQRTSLNGYNPNEQTIGHKGLPTIGDEQPLNNYLTCYCGFCCKTVCIGEKGTGDSCCLTPSSLKEGDSYTPIASCPCMIYTV
eukprot:TRINITY_DN1864_c0_g1_i1.p1 TRINITY_DN1864_c0_g1~~TRINITY_DN1864_c0_g1_i1.p1  ORF type:complete len:184 (+),score=10.87 TRINITY_DN1864_c0_g1_i1:307-858(+)